MFTKQFWRETAERALKTIAQAGLVVLGGNTVDAFSVDWSTFVGIAVGAGVASILTSIASNPFGPKESPSLVS